MRQKGLRRLRRHPNKQPIQSIVSVRRDVLLWLRNTDRTNMAGYAPGYTGDTRPTHRGIIG